eukprot:6376585-Prymnesium_polylepis.1
MALIKHTSALTLNVSGVFKDLLLIVYSVQATPTTRPTATAHSPQPTHSSQPQPTNSPPTAHPTHRCAPPSQPARPQTAPHAPAPTRPFCATSRAAPHGRRLRAPAPAQVVVSGAIVRPVQYFGYAVAVVGVSLYSHHMRTRPKPSPPSERESLTHITK